MKLETILSIEEIQTPRTPKEFIQWVEELFKKTDGIADEKLEKQLHLRTGIAKQLHEEIIPLEKLLRHKIESWSTIRVQNILGNQAYDVEIVKDGKSIPNIPDKLEMTYAILGEDHKLRMEHLVKHGWTSMTGPLSVKKTDGKRTVELESEAKLADETVVKVQDLIKTAIKKKCAKAYSIGTGLIIYVEDYGTFRDEKYFKKLTAIVENYLKLLKSKFHSVYLILSSDSSIAEWLL